MKELSKQFKANLSKFLTDLGYNNQQAKSFVYFYTNAIRSLNSILQLEKAALYGFTVDNFSIFGSLDVEQQAEKIIENFEDSFDSIQTILSESNGLLEGLIKSTLTGEKSNYFLYRNLEDSACMTGDLILAEISKDPFFYTDLNDYLFVNSPLYKYINENERFAACFKYVATQGETVTKSRLSNILETYEMCFQKVLEDNIDEDAYGEFRKLIKEQIEQKEKDNEVHADEEKNDILTDVKALPKATETTELTITKTEAHKIINDVFRHYAGFKEIKTELLKIIAKRWQNGENQKPHTVVLTGNPGTGKTTVAELMSKVLSQTKVLPKGVFKKYTAAELQAQYVGQTIPKVEKMFNECRGGTIFLDEFDSLNSNDSYCQEIVKKLLFELENPNNKNTMIVIAGYEDKLKSFFEADAGLKSRFQRKFHIKDYSFDELLEIEKKILERLNYHMYPEAQELYQADLQKQMQVKNFGNARYIQSSLDAIIDNQSMRAWEENDNTNRCIMKEDVEQYIKQRENNVTKENKLGFSI